MDYKQTILILLPVFALYNLFTGAVPLLAFAIILLSIQFYCLNKFESAFLFLMFASVFGVFFFIYGIRGVGTILFLFSLIIFLREEKVIYSEILKCCIPLIAILLFFTISVFISSGGDYATDKLSQTYLSAVYTVVPISLFFYKIEKFNLIKLALMIITYGLFTYSVGIEYLNIPRIGDILDVGYFRIHMGDTTMQDNNIVSFNYQRIGFYGCFALSLLGFYDNPTIKDNSKLKLVIVVLSSLVVLYSGSRQSILAWIILILIIYAKGKIFTPKIIIASVFVFAVFEWFKTLDIWIFSSLFEADNILEGAQRDQQIEAGLNQFKSSPILGIGYGRFLWQGGYGNYPHNFLVELLCECGIIGTLYILMIPIVYFFRVILVCDISRENLVGVSCLILPYIIRALVSSDMSYNIETFAILFMIPLIRNNYQNNNIEDIYYV